MAVLLRPTPVRTRFEPAPSSVSPADPPLVRLSVAEAAAVLAVSDAVIRTRIRRGQLHSERIGARRYVLLPATSGATHADSGHRAVPPLFEPVQTVSETASQRVGTDETELVGQLRSEIGRLAQLLDAEI